MNQIPNPSKLDVYDVLMALAAWHENMVNQYQDGEVSKEVYDHECLKQFQRLLSLANCVDSTNELGLIEFWTRHRDFSEWSLLKPRDDAYLFLPPRTT